MVNKVIKVSAPGKIILSGEHSVVYGQPAILAAINKRLYIEIKKGSRQTKIISDENPYLAHHALFNVIPTYLNVIPAKATSDVAKAGIYKNKKMLDNLIIKIRSEIPVNRGLGSSAALAVALTGALLRWFNQKWDKKLINQIALAIEKKQHHHPSGADNSICLLGGLIIFQKGKIKPLNFTLSDPEPLGLSPSAVSSGRICSGRRPVEGESKGPKFIFLDSGPAIESTGEMVAAVRRKFQAPPASPSACRGRANSKFQTIIKELGQTTKKIIESLLVLPSPLTPLISQNQRLLEDLGVVGQKAKQIVKEIENLGGAAKICGAGGLKKGSGILLCYHQSPQVLLNFAQKNNLKNYQLKLGAEGLKNED